MRTTDAAGCSDDWGWGGCPQKTPETKTMKNHITDRKDGKSTLIEENYENNVLNGDYKVFYEDGKLTKHSLYKDGKLHGNSKKYSPESILIEDVNYVNGQLHGFAAFYEDNGNLKQKGMYEEDLKVGPWEFFEDGELSETKEIKVWKDKE